MAMELLEVKLHTLLSRDEIAYCIRALGATDVVAILDSPTQPRMGGGTLGMLVATALNVHQLRSVADGLVRQLRLRKLHEVGVIGAEMGPEGSFRDADESWFVIDCQNYVVHLMDETTRTALRLEDLWSGKDGMHRLNLLDESAVDEYVSQNPVPDEYNSHSFDADEAFKHLEKLRWTVPHVPAIAKTKRGKNKGQRRSRASR
jgi:ribosomal silencing factor RsfS